MVWHVQQTHSRNSAPIRKQQVTRNYVVYSDPRHLIVFLWGAIHSIGPTAPYTYKVYVHYGFFCKVYVWLVLMYIPYVYYMYTRT